MNSFVSHLKPGLAFAVATALSVSVVESQTVGHVAWDWTGIIGTGQSLSVGSKPVLSTNQTYNNLKLSTGKLPWPVDSEDTNLTLVPLVEPIGRMAPGYPSSWPENIYGETPHTAMANQITAMVRAASGRDFISVHEAVGESGKGMEFIRKVAVRKDVNGRAYEASMIETKATARLAVEAGKSYGVGAIVLSHGESDAGNTNYEADVLQLWRDYNADLKAITGQRENILMIVSQQNSCNDRSPSTQAQWRIGVDYRDDIVCSGPKYQYESPDGVHLTSQGYQQLGEKYGQVFYERVIRRNSWQPLHPTKIERKGRKILVHYHVPVPPLVWESRFERAHAAVQEWKNGKGFEVFNAQGVKIIVADAEIAGDVVVITCKSDPGPGAGVSYAMIGEKEKMAFPFHGLSRWGLLRDSDPFKGTITGVGQPNYSVAFEMTAP